MADNVQAIRNLVLSHAELPTRAIHTDLVGDLRHPIRGFTR